MSSKYKVSNDIVFRRSPDGSVIIMKMDESSLFFKLTDVSAVVWNMLGKGENVNTIVSKVVSEYDVTQDIALKDINELISNLEEKKFISSF